MQQFLSRQLGDNIVTVTNNVLHTFLKIFAVVKCLPCFPIIADTGNLIKKAAHNEGDISTRVLPRSVNFFLFINMGMCFGLPYFALPNYDIQNGCGTVQTCIRVMLLFPDVLRLHVTQTASLKVK